MKKFIDEDFLLNTDTAKSLFNNSAKVSPIFDYHCHLIPSQIAENKKFKNLTEVWLYGDHYKWRQMRTFGIEEKFITGDASDYDKFLAWASTVENLIGNPLYHWTHLELQRYFNIYEPLNKKTAESIWKKANEKLSSDELSVKGIFEKFNVYAVGTTDDPIDSLEYHKAIKEGSAKIGKINTKVLPSFRPDKALLIDIANMPYGNNKDFSTYINELSKVSGVSIKKVDDVIEALIKRLDYFVELGCVASDHALEYPPCKVLSDELIDKAFTNSLNGERITKDEADAYKTKVLSALSQAYSKKGIIMQLHFSAIRNNNLKMFGLLGADTGFDAVSDKEISSNLSGLLNLMSKNASLPKTVVYTLNPKDYYPLATLMGAFQGDGIKGKIQLGSGWWFLDHKDGMNEQLRVLGNLGMLPSFIGMLTDSRSFLSYPRHEYFRRILCNLIGDLVENGEYPNDTEKLSSIVSDICFNNALNYFKK